MAQQHDREQKARTTSSRRMNIVARALNSYASVLCLFVLDYVAASLAQGPWSTVLAVFLLGATLLLAFYISHMRRIWVMLAALFLVSSTLSAVLAAVVPGATVRSKIVLGIAGLLLIGAPVVILRRVARDSSVTGETILGAICVYLLYGMSFAFVFMLDGVTTTSGFFGTGQQANTTSNYLFFSYTTLTTVGYGNLIPATQAGQTLAMLEALFGQIFLVIVVARLVSLWGQQNPREAARRRKAEGSEAPAPDSRQQEETPLPTAPTSDQNR
jgi:hypothetical protein